MIQLITLKLKNIKKHTDKVINFNKKSTLIIGKNGSGKSTILESIFYALFRKLLVPNIDYLINDDIKEIKDGKIKYYDTAKIELTFEVNNEIYKIEHVLGKKTSIKLSRKDNNNWEIISTTIRDSMLYLSKKLGINEHMFTNIIYTPQMQILNLFNITDTERYKVYNKIFDVEKFEKIRASIGNIIKKYKNDIDEGKILSYQEQRSMFIEKINEYKQNKKILEKRIEESQNKINKLKKEINRMNNEFTSKSEQYNKELENYNQLLNIYNQIIQNKKDIETLKNQLFEKEKEKIEIDKLIEKYSNYLLSINFPNLVKKFYNYKNNIENINKNLTKELQLKKQRLQNLENSLLEKNNLKNQINFFEENIQKKTNQLQKIKSNISKLKIEIKNQDNTEKISELNTSLEHLKQEIIMNLNYIKPEYRSLESIINNDIDDIFDMNEVCPLCGSKFDINEKLNKKELLKNNILKFISINNELTNLINLQNEIDFKKNNIIQLENELKNLEDEIKQLVENKMLLETKIKQIIFDEDEIDNLKTEIEDIQIKLNTNDITLLNNIDISLKKLYSINIESINTKEIIASDEIRIISETINNCLFDMNQKKMKVNELQNQINNLQIKIQEKENLINSYNISIEENLKKLQDMYENLTKQSENLNDLNTKINDLKIQIKSEENNLNNTKLDYQSFNFDTKIQDYKEKIKNIDNYLNGIKEVKKKIEKLEIVKKIFSNDQLPLFIKRKYIHKINEFLPKIFTMFNFDFIPQIDYDTLNIKDYHKYSGGQKITIALCIKYILSSIFHNQKMMLLDEPTPYLDSERIFLLSDFLEKMSKKLQLIIITHEEELKNNITNFNIIEF